jgi:hypothetical protein
MKDMIPRYRMKRNGWRSVSWIRQFDWSAVALVALLAALIAVTVWALFGVKP